MVDILLLRQSTDPETLGGRYETEEVGLGHTDLTTIHVPQQSLKIFAGDILQEDDRHPSVICGRSRQHGFEVDGAESQHEFVGGVEGLTCPYIDIRQQVSWGKTWLDTGDVEMVTQIFYTDNIFTWH